jgi:hypothetical protein
VNVDAIFEEREGNAETLNRGEQFEMRDGKKSTATTEQMLGKIPDV